MRTYLLAVLTSVAASALAAPSPAGTWKGHVVLSPQQMQIKGAEAFSKITISLALNKDHTFRVHSANMPFKRQRPDDTGKWSIKGDTVTLAGTSGPGDVQTFKVSKNGRQMIGSQGQAKLVFSR